MTITCFTGSVLINRLGFRYALALGTVGYSIYSAALYQNNCHGTQWFIYLGSAACGVTAGFFWAAEGAIMLSYPPPENRGKYLAYWLAYRNSGSILGGAINLAFNYSRGSLGKLDWRTYIVFVVLRMSAPWYGRAEQVTDRDHRVSWACSCVVAFEPRQSPAKRWKRNPRVATNFRIDRVQRDNEIDAAERVPVPVSYYR
jgi:MFS family permease